MRVFTYNDCLPQGLEIMKNIAEKIARIQTEKRADMLGEEPNSHLRTGLLEVAYEWARGMVSISG